jgi:hypothetical protein
MNDCELRKNVMRAGEMGVCVLRTGSNVVRAGETGVCMLRTGSNVVRAGETDVCVEDWFKCGESR